MTKYGRYSPETRELIDDMYRVITRNYSFMKQPSDDPCGEAMKQHMEKKLREMIANGPPHAEWERLKRIEIAAREVERWSWALRENCGHEAIDALMGLSIALHA